MGYRIINVEITGEKIIVERERTLMNMVGRIE